MINYTDSVIFLKNGQVRCCTNVVTLVTISNKILFNKDLQMINKLK